jgi:uncharacterized membrane protein
MRIGDILRSDRFDTESVHDLSGAVFAFALTLLILDLVVPEIPKGSSETVLVGALVNLWPHILTYVISFGLIASYWVLHRRIFTFIKRADRMFLWMNLLFLMCIAFMPFATKLMGAYPRYHVALFTYAGTAMVTLLVQCAQWRYATGRGRLVDPDLPPQLILYVARRLVVGVFLGLICIGISFFDPLVSLFLFIAMPVLTMWPARLDFSAQSPGEQKS